MDTPIEPDTHIEPPNTWRIRAFEEILNFLEGIVARRVEINLEILQNLIRTSERLCLVIRDEIQNRNIPDGHIPAYSNFINRYISMFEGIVLNSNLKDEQKNLFRVPIENLRSTLNLLELYQNQRERIQPGGKKITRNKKSRKGKKSRRKNRKSRRKNRKI